MTFPINFERAIKKFAEQQNKRLSAHEYHGLELRVLGWYEGKTLHKLQFEEPKDNMIPVTRHQDTFKMFPKFLNWCHNSIPMFPYLAAMSFEKLEDIATNLSEDKYLCIFQKIA